MTKPRSKAMQLAAQSSRASVIRAYEIDIATKVQQEHGATENRQAPLTLLEDEKGNPIRFVVPTTDETTARKFHAAATKGVPLTVQHHTRPEDDVLDEYQRVMTRLVPGGRSVLPSEEPRAALEEAAPKRAKTRRPALPSAEPRAALKEAVPKRAKTRKAAKPFYAVLYGPRGLPIADSRFESVEKARAALRMFKRAHPSKVKPGAFVVVKEGKKTVAEFTL